MRMRKIITVALVISIFLTIVPFTAMAAGLEGLFLRSKNDVNEHGIYFNVTGMTPNEEHDVKVELYSGEKLLQTKTITRKSNAKGKLGGTFYTVGVSSSWGYTLWTAYDYISPTHATVYVDGVKMNSVNVAFGEAEWIPFPSTLPAPAPAAPSVPQTGDETPIMVAILMMMLSAGAFVLLGKRKHA